MEQPVLVTEHTRERIDCGGFITSIRLPKDEEARAIWERIDGRTTYKFRKMRDEPQRLIWELTKAIEEKNERRIRRIREEIEKYRIPTDEELTDKEKWNAYSGFMPRYGPRNTDLLARIITFRAKGQVLEAMAGFRTYFTDENPEIEEVTAIDNSEEALKRYKPQTRKRILFDLERVCEGEKIEFFPEETFDTIGITFGVNYLSRPRQVYKEFHRILKTKGNIIIVNGTSSGYSNLVKHWFKPEETTEQLEEAGFKTRKININFIKREELVPIPTDYWMIEGTKK